MHPPLEWRDRRAATSALRFPDPKQFALEAKGLAVPLRLLVPLGLGRFLLHCGCGRM